MPWQAVATATPPPTVAGFTLAPAAGNNNSQFASLSAVPAPLAADADEDTAEAHRAPDENYATLKTQAPALASAAIPPQPVPSAVPNIPIPAIRPTPRPNTPDLVAALPKPQQLAAVTPPPKAPPPQAATASPKPAVPPRPPQIAAAAPANPAAAKPQQFAAAVPPMRPAIKSDAGEGDTDQQASAGSWTIQVGAFGNATLAETQLNLYAAKANDIVGQAAHIVAPIQSANGHTLYRARFGPYAEREARDVCGQLTQRGQACFPVVTR